MGHAEAVQLLLTPVGLFCSVCIQAATAEANMSLISSHCWRVVQLYMSQQADRSLGIVHLPAG